MLKKIINTYKRWRAVRAVGKVLHKPKKVVISSSPCSCGTVHTLSFNIPEGQTYFRFPGDYFCLKCNEILTFYKYE